MTTQPPKTYIIEPEQAESMAKSKNLTLPQLLPYLIQSAQTLAHPPISNFPVGVVGLTSDHRIFLGGNIEFPGLPLHHTIHAEQFFITNLAAHSAGAKLLYLAVSAAPCGHCRQFFQELRGISDTQIVITDQPEENPVYVPFSSIFPNAFGPLSLLSEHTPLILDKHNNQLTLKDDDFIIQDGNTIDVTNGFCDLSDNNKTFLKTQAFEAARESHAPSASIIQDGNSTDLRNGFSELIARNENFMKTEDLEAARDSHASKQSSIKGCDFIIQDGKTMDVLAGFYDLTDKNGTFSEKKSLEAARGSHAPNQEGNTLELTNGFCELSAKNEEFLKMEALLAVREAHAPYSGCPSGVALMDSEGKVYKGSYMESAAYNPSMMPVQAAVVAYMVAGGGGYERIVAAVLVEKEGAVVRQEDTARMVLKHISPKCVFRVVHCN